MNKINIWKILLLSTILFLGCKDDDYTEPKPNEQTETPTNPVNGTIGLVSGLDINTITIQNGNINKNVDSENFEIDALSDDTSARDSEGNIIYLHDANLSSNNIAARGVSNTNSIELTPKETARALLFNSLGGSLVSNEEAYKQKVGQLIENDTQLGPLFTQYVEVIRNDIEEHGKLTMDTYISPVKTEFLTVFKNGLGLSSTILNWQDSAFELSEEESEVDYNVNNKPYFLVNVNGELKRSKKIGSFRGGCVIDITNATKNTDGTWNIKLDYYNKFPAVKYITKMYKDLGGERIYNKSTLDNLIRPYNSTEYFNDITSLQGFKDFFVDLADISQNGIMASDLQTSFSTKNKVTLSNFTTDDYLLVGNVAENNQLMIYSMIDILSKSYGLMKDIDKIGDEKGKDDKAKTDLLLKFWDYLKSDGNEIGASILQNVQIIINNRNDITALNTHVLSTSIDLAKEFMKWISSEVGSAALSIYIQKKETINLGDTKLNKLKVIKNIYSSVKNQNLSLEQVVDVLGDKFPLFKTVYSGLQAGAVAQDIFLFYLNINVPVLDKKIHLPYDNNVSPENGATISTGTEFSISFDTPITLTDDTTKVIEIKDFETSLVRQTITIDQITIHGNTVKFTPTNLEPNKQYYVTVPVNLIFNAQDEPFAGIYTNDLWRFEADDTFTNTGSYPEEDKIFVQGGTFQMGNDDEQPIHEVTVSDFYIGKYEITNSQYVEFLNSQGNQTEEGYTWLDINSTSCQIEQVNGTYQAKTGKDNYPVIMVTWYGAKAYADWVGGRLPTEAEWEYAAKGGNQTNSYTYSGSNTIDDVAWYYDNSQNSNNNIFQGKGTHTIGTKQPNELGIYDMSGNVKEWCGDLYGNYTSDSQTDPQGPSSGNDRVLRGGSWGMSSSSCLVEHRRFSFPFLSSYHDGVRVVFLP